jgi:hypothetical protein
MYNEENGHHCKQKLDQPENYWQKNNRGLPIYSNKTKPFFPNQVVVG